jgi:hypothetical protein
MPWKTYKTDVQKFTAKEYEFTLKNFFNKSISNNLNQYHVYDKSDNSLVFSSNQFLNNQPNFPADSSITMNHTINKPLPDNDFRFPVNDTLTRKTFDIQLTSLTNETQINYDNDTIAFSQIFDTYYAYDDGSAEKGYALVGAGAKIACQFTIDKKDTLRAVHFYFPPMMENVTLNTFSIHIWSNLNPETILYKTVLKNPQYSERNEFVRYDIDTILPLSGTFYVGWKQTTADKIYLGFDENIDTQSKIFYKTGTSWNNTVFDGSLMLRPDFGTPPPPPAGVSDNQNNYKNFNIFPNPASTHINLKNNISYEERYFYSLYDIFGREVLKSNNIGREISINVAQLPEGIYFIAISNSQNTLIETKKILIKR